MSDDGSDNVIALFAEYASAYLAGERPDVLSYLERAGDGAECLERLLDCYLQAAPLQPADEMEAALLEARSENAPALFVLRRRLRIGLETLTERLGELLRVPPAARPRLERRYQELELGVLRAERVTDAVWAGLHAVLGVDVRQMTVSPPPSVAAQAYARLTRTAGLAGEDDVVAYSLRPLPPELAGPAGDGVPPEEAEVDRLFGLG